MTLVQTVTKSLTALVGKPSSTPLLIGFSGGADSTALLHLVRESGYAVAAAHLDHGARPESAAEAASLAAACAGWGIPFHSARIAVPKGAGFEARARDVRLAWLAGLDFPVVALGHHQDDQAETILFRLVRGTGPEGLAGMRASRDLKPAVALIRPLLGVSRSVLRAWLVERGLSWLEDETNADPDFARNRLRRDVLPVLQAIQPGAVANMVGLADRLREEFAAMQEPISSMANHYMQVIAPGIGEVDRQAFNAAPIAHRRQLLRLLASRMGASPPDAAGIERALGTAESGGDAHLGRGWRIETDSSWLALRRTAPELPIVPLAPPGEQPTSPWGWRVTLRTDAAADGREGPCLVRFAAPALPPDLVWRTANPDGDRFQPWGRSDSNSLRRWLTRQGVPRHRQDSLLVLASRDTVVWVPGYGRSALAPLAEEPLNRWEMLAGAWFQV